MKFHLRTRLTSALALVRHLETPSGAHSVHSVPQDLRVQCRQRKLTPAGSKEELMERLKEHMQSSGDLCAPIALLAAHPCIAT